MVKEKTVRAEKISILNNPDRSLIELFGSLAVQ